jgi:hypothetical protein
MDDGANIQCFYYDQYTLQQLYDKVNGGPGTSVVEPAAATLTALAPEVSGSGQRLQQVMDQAKVSWQGQAAQAAGSAVAQVAQWASAAGGQATHSGGASAQDYASSWAAMKQSVPAPEPVPPANWWDDITDLFGTNSDHAKVVAENDNALRNAIDAMVAHEQHTRTALGSFSATAAVPEVTAQPGLPAGPGQPGGPAHPAAGTATGQGTPGAGHATPGAQPGTGGAGTPGGAAGSHGAGTGGPGSSNDSGTAAAPAPTTPSVATPHTPPVDGTGLPGIGGAAGSGATGSTGSGTPGLGGSGPAALPPLPIGGAPEYQPGKITAALNPGTAHQATPAPRGSGTPLDPRAGGSPTAAATEAGERAVRGAGPAAGGTPMGGGAGRAGQEREHRNNTYLASDEPFSVQFGDDVVPRVIGPEHLDEP